MAMYPAATALLYSVGIDPASVSIDEIEPESYLGFVLVDGKRIMDPTSHEAIKVRRSWPYPGFGASIISAMAEDERTYTRADMARAWGEGNVATINHYTMHAAEDGLIDQHVAVSAGRIQNPYREVEPQPEFELPEDYVHLVNGKVS